jgi:hypothetical protein
MTNKFDNLINNTFAGLIKEDGVEPEEVAQNPELALQQQAQTIQATGGPKNAKDKELVKKATQLQKSGAQKSSQTLAAVKDVEQAQKSVQS